MNMSKAVAARNSNILLLLHLILVLISFCTTTTALVQLSSLCIQTERQALIHFKRALHDPSHRLRSWTTDDQDCCNWAGVVCHNSTGHVFQLHLRNPIFRGDYERYADFAIAFRRSRLGGAINPSLLSLKHLRFIDLSLNDFKGIPIPNFLGSLQSLRHLNLSQAGFAGVVPHQLGNLSNLRYLNLRGRWDFNFTVDNLHWLSGLSSLQHLDLSYANLSKASDHWLQVTNSLPSLLELHLVWCDLQPFPPLPHIHVNFSSPLAVLDLSNNNFSIAEWSFSLVSLVSLNLGDCGLWGPIPSGLRNMTALRKLNLSYNWFNSTIPDWLYSLTHLEDLRLDGNDFHGVILNSIGNLTSLIGLDLGYNYNLQGGLPKSMRRLCNLKKIDLSGINLQGGLPKSMRRLCNLREINLSGTKLEFSEVTKLLSGCILVGLEDLVLDGNQLSGRLTDIIDNLGGSKSLVQLSLFDNSLSGVIPESIGKLTSLNGLNVGYNNLTGALPLSLGQLALLESLFLDGNSFDSVISEVHFEKLTILQGFYASDNNKLVFKFSPNWVPPFQLENLYLGSCCLGPSFPKWLQTQRLLRVVDISNTRIKDTIPAWFWEMVSQQFVYVSLSNNQIHGEIPNIPFAQSPLAMDLSSNHFEGPIPQISSNVTTLDLSNNCLSGPLSNFLCYKMGEPKYLQLLNLKGNILSSEIPNCWMNWTWLDLVNLEDNNLTGNAPSSFGSLINLQSLHLRNNHLYGEILPFLQNCTELIGIDLGGNKFVGSIPIWMGQRLAKLKVLNLRDNGFSGQIPLGFCALNSIQILDLASNNLFGTIPRCFNNFTAMASNLSSSGYISYSGGYQSIQESTILMMKGTLLEYTTTLHLFSGLDLSNNYFSGEIPTELTSLLGLRLLNLSRNLLRGKIPEKIGDMVLLESIDLSDNRLSGEIPWSMSKLTFLSVLNLSHNDLTGRIPSSTQLQGFNSSSFVDNHLCGEPLNEKCSTINKIPDVGNVVKETNGLEVDWFYVCMAIGFVVGFWGIMGPLLFNKSWRVVYFQFLDSIEYKLWM